MNRVAVVIYLFGRNQQPRAKAFIFDNSQEALDKIDQIRKDHKMNLIANVFIMDSRRHGMGHCVQSRVQLRAQSRAPSRVEWQSACLVISII